MRAFLAILILAFACISSVSAGGYKHVYYNVSTSTNATTITSIIITPCTETSAPFVNTTITHPILATATAPIKFVSGANLNTFSSGQGVVGVVMGMLALAAAQYVW